MKNRAGNDEEVLHEIYSEDWFVAGISEGWVPITLITYSDGMQDLHMQTGSHWDEAIEIAKEILEKRGLRVTGKDNTLASSGMYMAVEKI